MLEGDETASGEVSAAPEATPETLDPLPAEDAPASAVPEPPAEPSSQLPDAVLAEAVGGTLTWIPFAGYLGAWIALAGASAYLLYGASADMPARWLPAYGPLLWTGVGLAATGPVLSMAVWLIARSHRPAEARTGLFASAMTRGALVAFFGVTIWIATLFVLELVAAGGTI